MTTETLFLGIDGGGSRCRARLCDGRGRVLGEGEASAANVALGLDISFGEIHKAAAARPGDYGKFVPVIIDHAQAGDAAARGLLHETGEHVCLLVEALMAKGAPNVALVGGLAGPIQPWLPERIRPLLVEPKGDPLDGALMLARRRFDGTEAP